MLYSPVAKVAFAHYPKTAGHSLVSWFQATFPDALFVEPPREFTISHLPVRESLERLGLRDVPAEPRTVWERYLPGWLSGRPVPAGGMRIIGVVREPFEMLVSLYEYWRTYDFPSPPQPLLIRTARERPFRDFLELAVGAEPVQNYHDFFDVGGPAWPKTRLLDFHSLDAALAVTCRKLRLPRPREPLGRWNAGPRPARDLAAYQAEAGPLLDVVRHHFAWYYAEGRRLAVR
jgi:hypothetical protein